METTRLTFYRVDGSELTECGYHDMADHEWERLTDPGAAGLQPERELLDGFNANRPAERHANAIRVRNFTVQIGQMA